MNNSVDDRINSLPEAYKAKARQNAHWSVDQAFKDVEKDRLLKVFIQEKAEKKAAKEKQFQEFLVQKAAKKQAPLEDGIVLLDPKLADERYQTDFERQMYEMQIQLDALKKKGGQ